MAVSGDQHKVNYINVNRKSEHINESLQSAKFGRFKMSILSGLQSELCSVTVYLALIVLFFYVTVFVTTFANRCDYLS